MVSRRGHSGWRARSPATDRAPRGGRAPTARASLAARYWTTKPGTRRSYRFGGEDCTIAAVPATGDGTQIGTTLIDDERVPDGRHVPVGKIRVGDENTPGRDVARDFPLPTYESPISVAFDAFRVVGWYGMEPQVVEYTLNGVLMGTLIVQYAAPGVIVAAAFTPAGQPPPAFPAEQ